MAEWDDYRIKIPKAGSRENGAAELDDVNHVVHPAAARRILEDGMIRAGIVHDESRMNKTRHTVVWLSANTWSNGSIYGTVQFTFPWRNLIQGKRFYWVEAMAYANPAYRILVSDKDVSSLPFLSPYDPSTDRGPLRERDGTWYWNHLFTSEFLVDADLDLDDCSGFKGIPHKRDGCRLFGRSCSERDVLHFTTAGRMVAFLIGSGNHAVDLALKSGPAGSSRPLGYDVDNAISGIWFSLVTSDRARFGGVINKPDPSISVVRGALALFGAGRLDDALDLVSLLEGESTFKTALEAIVDDHFGVSGWKVRS